MATLAASSQLSALPRARPAALAAWLLGVAALVWVMVVVGGITRLTESGLSITEWKPVTGALPPLSDAAWEAEFAKYRETYQYAAQNAGMTLSAFKVIYFWEWFHRLLGRLIGLAFALPLAWFWWKRAIPAGYHARLLALLALGGLQGAIGWWMVTSGLWTGTEVSHVRLSVHLLTALLILGGLVWTALDLAALARDPGARPARLTPTAVLVLSVLFLQLLFGAWVAGLNAGYVSSTWPLMNGDLFPRGVTWVGSRTFVDDPFLTHFIHRWWAFVTVVALVVLARRARAAGDRAASVALHTAFGVQILLGIATVVLAMPLWAAASHQAVGALVVAASAWAAHVAGRARPA
ncbi:COX15/CtaA family protein [Thermaurantiacus tibetensis]|uniref:COX15/CtaA family protein n=1 Tax=Thermaurantiacus tibetensis TaxID=2759035 RepID=UPI001890998F|nr:COX15/CtaA family protein [Thermaurantiacus tibetensis]